MSEQALKGIPSDYRAKSATVILIQMITSKQSLQSWPTGFCLSLFIQRGASCQQGITLWYPSVTPGWEEQCTTTAEFNMCHPAMGSGKKEIVCCLFLCSFRFYPKSLHSGGILMISGALRKTHAMLGCHAKCTSCFWDLQCVLCTPITGLSGRKVGF